MYCQIRQYRLAIWPIPVGDLVNTGWRFGQHRLAIWPIPVGDLANTGKGTFSKIWAGLRDSKNMGGLRIMPRYVIKNKKNRFWLQKCPFNKEPNKEHFVCICM